MPRITGPTGLDGLPVYDGDPSVLRTLFTGSPVVCWIGDSLGVGGYCKAFARAIKALNKGWILNGDLTTSGPAGSASHAPGTANIYGSANYSICNTREIALTGTYTAVAEGFSLAIANRVAYGANYSGGIDPLTSAPRKLLCGNDLDWITAGSTVNVSTYHYNDANGIATASLRAYLRATDNAGAYAAASAKFANYAATPTYVELPFATPLTRSVAGIDLVAEMQIDDGTYAAGTRASLLAIKLINTSVATGPTFWNISQGGWTVANFIDTSKISQAAYNAMLAAAGVDTFVISLNANGSDSVADYQALRTALRLARPNSKIIWLTTHDTGTDTPNVSNCYTAFDPTTEAFINVHGAAGKADQFADWNAAGQFYSGAPHLTQPGYQYMGAVAAGLVHRMINDPGASNVHAGVAYSISSTGTAPNPDYGFNELLSNGGIATVGVSTTVGLIPASGTTWDGSTIFLASSNVGDTISPASQTPAAGSSGPAVFDWTPAAAAQVTLTPSNSGTLNDPTTLIVDVQAAAVYTAAANVRDGTDRGDGVSGTLVVPAASYVLAGTTFDNGTVGTAAAVIKNVTIIGKSIVSTDA